MSERKFKQVGSLWQGTDRRGQPYWSGEVEIDGAILGVLIFPNRNKKPGSRQPDYNIIARENELNLVEDQIADAGRSYSRG